MGVCVCYCVVSLIVWDLWEAIEMNHGLNECMKLWEFPDTLLVFKAEQKQV